MGALELFLVRSLFSIVCLAGVAIGFFGLMKNKLAAILTIVGWGILLSIAAFFLFFGYLGILDLLGEGGLVPETITTLQVSIREVGHSILYQWKLAPLLLRPTALVSILLGLYFFRSPASGPTGTPRPGIRYDGLDLHAESTSEQKWT